LGFDVAHGFPSVVLKGSSLIVRVPSNNGLLNIWVLLFSAITRMNAAKTAPISRFLIVDDPMWFGQKPDETLEDSQFPRAFCGIIGAASAPTIKNRALGVKFSNARDCGGHWDAFGADASHQSVIDINVNDGNLWVHAILGIGESGAFL
jgi:hypothetical protein